MTKKLCISYNRFSSAKQAEGDSLRRQTEAARKYAEEHDLEFDETIVDEGISAFKGDNNTKGKLGRFLARVKKGTIPRGSVLVIENLDRMSRRGVREAMPIFLDIVNAGIWIHTTTDNMTFSDESIDANYTDLLISMLSMVRANQESEMKSQRIKAAWKNKRDQAKKSGQVMTATVPGWLELKEGVILSIPERANVIKLIFNLAKDGYGEVAICRHLNANKVKSWHKEGKGWYRGYISKILRNKAVYGVLETKKIEAIDGYYPLVVEKPLFDQVQAVRTLRQKPIGKRMAVSGSNLFTGITECPICGDKMVVGSTGEKKGIYKSLMCRNHFHKNGRCKSKVASFPLRDLERAFLAACNELNTSEIINSESDYNAEIEGKRAVDQALEAQIDQKKSFLDKLVDSLEKEPVLEDTLLKKMRLIQEEINSLQIEHKQAAAELLELEVFGSNAQQHLKEIQDLYEVLDGKDGEKARNKLRLKIVQLVKSIDVYPMGYDGQDRDFRAFTINFRSGAFKDIGFDWLHGYHFLTDSTGTNTNADEIFEALSKTKFRPKQMTLYHPNERRKYSLMVVQRAKRMKEKRLSFTVIAEQIEKEGYLTSKGNPYSPQSLAKLYRENLPKLNKINTQ